MKKFTCYDCSQEFEASDRDDVLNQLYTHYMKEHNAIITGIDEEGKKKWMDRFDDDWSKISEG